MLLSIIFVFWISWVWPPTGAGPDNLLWRPEASGKQPLKVLLETTQVSGHHVYKNSQEKKKVTYKYLWNSCESPGEKNQKKK